MCEKQLIFSVAGAWYALPARLVSEVARFETVCPLPLLPGYVAGVINRCSVPYALLDLGLLLRGERASRSKMILLKESEEKLAFLIDDALDIAGVPQSAIRRVNAGKSGRMACGMARAAFRRNNREVFVLDTARILKKALRETAELFEDEGGAG